MKLEEALTALRGRKKIRHSDFGKEKYLCIKMYDDGLHIVSNSNMEIDDGKFLWYMMSDGWEVIQDKESEKDRWIYFSDDLVDIINQTLKCAKVLSSDLKETSLQYVYGDIYEYIEKMIRNKGFGISGENKIYLPDENE